MIKCYKDRKSKDGMVVELHGDAIQITSEFVCIASKMMHSGIPFKILEESLKAAEKYKNEWVSDDQG